MPALELAAPGVPLAPGQQSRRVAHSRRAAAALDEAWALLSRMQAGGPSDGERLLDDAERIVANLEYEIGGRRLAQESEPS
jgi:hypothetical protein